LRIVDARRHRMAARPGMGAPVDVAVGLEAGQELEGAGLHANDLLEIRAALPWRRGTPAGLVGRAGLPIATAGRRRWLGAHPVSVSPWTLVVEHRLDARRQLLDLERLAQGLTVAVRSALTRSRRSPV